jgi:glycosyltransferase EpsF
MRPRRVLHLITWLNRGGVESWILTMLGALPRDEWALDVCCQGKSTGELAPAAEVLGAIVHHCPLQPTLIPYLRRLRGIITGGKYDLVHIHTNAHSGLGVLAAKQAGVPSVVTYHNTSFPPQTRLTSAAAIRELRGLYGAISQKYASRHASSITGVSEGVLEALRQRRALEPGRGEVFYLGVPDPPALSPEDEARLRAELGLGSDPVILHVGRFAAQKNHAGLLRIFARVLSAVPRARLLVVGNGPLRPEIEALSGELGIRDRCHFPGVRGDVAAIMQTADLFLFPSHHEGLPIVVMEAGLARLPVVGSRLPGMLEATDNGRTALLHQAGDEEGMSESAVRLLTDAAAARELAEGAEAVARGRFSQEAAAVRLVDLYSRHARP